MKNLNQVLELVDKVVASSNELVCHLRDTYTVEELNKNGFVLSIFDADYAMNAVQSLLRDRIVYNALQSQGIEADVAGLVEEIYG